MPPKLEIYSNNSVNYFSNGLLAVAKHEELNRLFKDVSETYHFLEPPSKTDKALKQQPATAGPDC